MRFAEFLKTLDDEKRSNSLFSNDTEKNKNLDRILEITKRINQSLILDEVLQLVLKMQLKLLTRIAGLFFLKKMTAGSIFLSDPIQMISRFRNLPLI